VRSNATQKATEEAAEMPITTQTIRHNLRKLKDSLHEIVEHHNQETQARSESEEGESKSNVQTQRQQGKFTKRIGQILMAMEPQQTTTKFSPS
jgi:vesicle coat complex subunit